MSKISAADVKKLRDATGAGMMDCKKALQEADGDFQKAIEVLRKKGQKVSAKRADREAKEGVVIAKANAAKDKGIVLRISSETDFVAKNKDFISLAEKVADIALQNFPDSKEELLELQYDDELTIKEKLLEQVGVIGEKIELVDYEYLEAGLIVPYIHMGYKAGVILGLNKSINGAAEEAGRNLAMQVAAMRPISVDKDEVDQEIVDKELEIAKEQAKQMGKPEKIIDRIAQGMLDKFFQESTLVNQAYVKGDMSVREYLKSISPDLKVVGFRHIELG